ncbi:MAG: rRNA pseudouridine synthase [Planctomycetes bacterium]|nr:rRNA pseudouridine synthase [Planctomycetota bacterium]
MARRHEDRKPGQRFARGGDNKPRFQADRRGNGGKPGPRQPLRSSSRRTQGLVVTPTGAPEAGSKDGKVRLNHFLAMSGVCSRRAADGLIRGGRVEVNGELVTELGVRVDPEHDDVRFDGSRVQPERSTYVLFNKPTGVVCTNAKHEQKKRVIDMLPTVKGRLFTVGRLDLDSEGLLLLTNDGSFALEMTHPRFGVPKLYAVLVRGRIEQSDIDKARGGVWLAEGPTAGMNIRVERTGKDRTFMKVMLREGKNREIRRVFAKLGYPVLELKRIRIGELTLHGLSPGKWRFLQKHEVAELRRLAREQDVPPPSTAGDGGRDGARGGSVWGGGGTKGDLDE